jgi:hypothetical protein
VQNTHLEDVEYINEIYRQDSWKNVGKRTKIRRKELVGEECQIILEDKKRNYNKMINRNTRQNKQEQSIKERSK